jgi:DNA-directed RNA polymerase specialized sigma24 family protein
MNTYIRRDRGAEERRWSALLAHARLAAASVLGAPCDHPDVEDHAQDAMVAFLGSGLRRFDPSRGTPEALVGVIARNFALGHVRTRGRRARLGAAFHAAARTTTDGDHPRVEAARDLSRILETLHAAHADALVAIDLHGERIGEAARRLGKTYGAVNAQVGHARAAARRVGRELLAA